MTVRVLRQHERLQVSGAGVEVQVNTPEKFVKVHLTALFGLIRIPLANVNWGMWRK